MDKVYEQKIISAKKYMPLGFQAYTPPHVMQQGDGQLGHTIKIRHTVHTHTTLTPTPTTGWQWCITRTSRTPLYWIEQPVTWTT